MEKKDEVVSKSKDVVELIAKVMLGALGLCYAMGLVTTNLYYGRYGVYSLSLFRLNYVIAGLWLIIPILVTFLILFSFFRVLQIPRAGKSKAPNSFLTFLTLLSAYLRATVLAGVAISIPFNLVLLFRINLRASDWIALTITSLMILATFLAFWYYLYQKKVQVTLQLVVAFTIVFFFSTFSHILGFAARVYGRIPAHLSRA